MAKKTSGLPSDFDLKVTSTELIGRPARIPGYLDDKPNFFQTETEEIVQPLAKEVERIVEPQPAPVVSAAPSQISQEIQKPIAPLHVLETKAPKKPVEKVRRMQINVTPDVERKAEELVEILSRLSPDNRVTLSDLMQALVLNLYDAKDSINGRLPARGRWGSLTAKSYASELSKILREALLKKWDGKTVDPFKSVVGG